MDFLKRMGLKVVTSVLGVIIMIGYWTVSDACAGRGGSGGGGELNKVPAKVWQGGSPVTIETDVSHAGFIRVSFERPKPGGQEHEYVHAQQNLAAGHHTFTISVPPGVSGVLETEILQPPSGATASISLDADGKHLEDKGQLEGALEPGSAFFVQIEVNDWATASNEGD